MAVHIAISKVASCFCMVLSAVLGCVIPSLIARFPKKSSGKQRAISDGRLCLCNCLGAGIIMGISFLHIIPESVEQCHHALLVLKVGHGSINVCYLMILASFCMMLFIERVVSSGRDPCTATFNACDPGRNCCDTGSQSSAKSYNSEEEFPVIVDKEELEDTSHHKSRKVCALNPLSGADDSCPIGSRFRHAHSEFLASIKKVLCPLCECNGLCITTALFLHSVFEGIAIGLEDNHIHLWLVTLGIVLHKWAAGMALASFLSGDSDVGAVIMKTIFCLGSPLGVFIGALTSATGISASALLNSIAAGTLNYVGVEIIAHELFCDIHCRKTALRKWICVIGGIVLIFVMVVLDMYLNGEHHHS